MEKKKDKKNKKEIIEINEEDFFLKPINSEGTIFQEEETGAIFTLERNLINGQLFLKQHNKGISKSQKLAY